jgi:hypothetical protein
MNVIERAFELARTSSTMSEVSFTLKREGYVNVDAHLAGRLIKAQLKKLLMPAT